MNRSSRMRREAKTVEVMIRQYCRLKHQNRETLCPDCAALLAYSKQRLAHCPFQEGKTSCGKCKIHCYKPDMRQKIRDVMRTIGPRMVFTNPVMSFYHLIDGLRKNPAKK